MIGKAWIEYVLIVMGLAVCGAVAFVLPPRWPWTIGGIALGAGCIVLAMWLQERRFRAEYYEARFGRGRRR